MNWIDACPVALVTVGWLLGPGLVLGYLLGLRGVVAWAVAPVIGIAVTGVSAVGLELAGVAWSAGAVAAVVAALTAVAFLLRHVFPASPDPRVVPLAAAAGLLPALALGVATVVRAMGRPDALSQVFDTPFHYNAVAHILDSHRASALSVAALGNPDVPAAFYPVAWHDIVSLVVMTTGADIPTASNVLAAVVAVVLWPLSCLLLARQLFGPRPAALAATGVLSAGFPAFPWDLMGFGVLWPNLLGMSLAPAGLALVVTLTGWAREDRIGRPRAWLLLVVGACAAALAHPNVVFSLVVLSVFFAGASLVRRARRVRGRRAVAELAGFAAGSLLAWWWAATTPVFAAAREWVWRPFETPANAAGEVLLNATNRFEALWVLSAVVLLGVLAAWRGLPVLRLVVAGHVATGLLYVLAAAVNRPDTQKLIGYWYNDSHRLAAMVPITAVPLAVGGVLFLAGRVHALLRRRWEPRHVTAGALAVALTALVVASTGLLYPDDRARRVMFTYPRAERAKLVTDDMREFYAEVAPLIPRDAVVAGNPFDGSVMLWALEGRRVLYPHFLAGHSAAQEYLAGHLDRADEDPRVCALAEDLGVEYLLIGKSAARTNDDYYRGVANIAQRSATPPGFELLAERGETRLFRITACDDHATNAVNRPRPTP